MRKWFSRYWISDSWRTVIPDKQEMNEVSPVIHLTYWLGNPRPWHRGRGRRGNWRRSHLWDTPGDSGQVNRARREIKGIWLNKEKVKVSSFAYDRIFHVQNPRNFFFWATKINEVKASASNVEDPGSIPGSGRSPGEGNGNPLQYSCLENPIDRNLVVYSPRGCKESDTTERLHFFTSLHKDI